MRRGCLRSFPVGSSNASRSHARLITSPQILLLDEPLSALDPFLRLRMRAELKKLQRELGISFIHVTHGQDEAMALADIVVLMNGGRIEQQGSPREIFNHPRTEFTAKFIGGHNVIAIGDETFAVREDRLKLRRPDEAVNGPSMAGTVSEVEYQGTYVRVAIVADAEPTSRPNSPTSSLTRPATPSANAFSPPGIRRRQAH
jgi:ABC-type spermidine/putrescine transport systems, ATPase components